MPRWKGNKVKNEFLRYLSILFDVQNPMEIFYYSLDYL